MTYEILTLTDRPTKTNAAICAERVLEKTASKTDIAFAFKHQTVNAACKSDDVEKKVKAAHAVLFDFSANDGNDILYGICKSTGLYAKVQNVRLFKQLKSKTIIAASRQDIDLAVVSDFLGGIGYGDKGFRTDPVFGRAGYDTECYSELEIERTARIAYELAETRGRHLTLVDKADTLTSAKLWRKIVTDINEDYPFVHVDMIGIGKAIRELNLNSSQFDVMVTTNLFGTILNNLTENVISDICPVSYLGDTTLGAYGITSVTADTADNTVAMVLSAANMLRHSFDLNEQADIIEKAVKDAVSELCRNDDYSAENTETEILNRL